jgi:hypothetical protein
MKQRSITKLIVGIIIGCLLAVLFAYLSFLGENNRVGTVVRDLFVSLRQHDFPQAYQYLSGDAQKTLFHDREQFYETCFLVELSLLKKYNLLDQTNYLIEIRKGHLWTPFREEKTVPVSILFRKQEPRGLFDVLRGPGEMDFVDNLISVVRESGTWKIKSINYTNTSIADTFQQLKEQVALDQYIKKTPGGFQVAPFTVTTQGMTPLEERRLAFIIHKALRFLDEAEKLTAQ